MHDFFDIVGLSRSAPPVEVRRVCARLTRRAHPDFQHPGDPLARFLPFSDFDPPVQARRDVAVDFVQMSAMLDRIQATFFLSPPTRTC